jgi:putative endonuclease
MASGGTLAQRRGGAAEDLAALHVAAAGLRVIARNFRCRAGELDLVCVDRKTLVIIEVRQRSGAAFGGPLASVDLLKRRRIARTTEYFRMCSQRWADCPVRFDVIAVLGPPGGGHELTWIQDAFRV